MRQKEAVNQKWHALQKSPVNVSKIAECYFFKQYLGLFSKGFEVNSVTW